MKLKTKKRLGNGTLLLLGMLGKVTDVCMFINFIQIETNYDLYMWWIVCYVTRAIITAALYDRHIAKWINTSMYFTIKIFVMFSVKDEQNDTSEVRS